MLNVGWLEPPHPFPVGEVPEGFVAALELLGDEPENLTRGFHCCQHCGFDAPTGNGEIHVVGVDRVRYSAPRLVVHYVAGHRYRPPQGFVDAVMGRANQIWAETDTLFAAAGWTPGRAVDTSAWRGMFPGLVWHDAVDAFLAEFGGLSFDGVELDPERCVAVADRFVKWSKTFRGVVPVGVAGELFLGVDRNGEMRGFSDRVSMRVGVGRHAIYKLSKGLGRE